MGQRTKHTFLNARTTASAGSLYQTDYRFDNGGIQRNIFGILTSGAEVNLYLTVVDGTVSVTHLEDTISADSGVFTTATNSFSTVINGPVDKVEVRKAGTSGTATVIGIL